MILCYGLFSNQLRFKSEKYCDLKKQAHDVVISIVENLKKYQEDPQKIFFYGKRGVIVPVQGCTNNPIIRTEKIMDNAEHITAHYLDYKFNPVIPLNDITSINLYEFNMAEKILVVFNFDETNLSELTKVKIESLGYHVYLKSIERFKLLEHEFTYHIFGILRKSPFRRKIRTE